MSGENGSVDPDYKPDSSDDEEPEKKMDKQKLAAKEDRAAKKKVAQMQDVISVKKHFAAFLKQEEIEALPGVDSSKGKREVLVPTYVGALNRNIKQNGMLSIMIMLAKEAENYYRMKLANPSRPLAFVLFTSVIDKNEKIPGIEGAKFLYEEGNDTNFVCTGMERGRIVWKPNTRAPASAVCFVRADDPDNPKLKWMWFFVTSAGAAIEYMHRTCEKEGWGRPIIAILGYDMLQAGLTIQKTVDNYHYCPRYLALATSEFMPLDAQLQIAGRTFFDFYPAKLERAVLPSKEEWPIDVLGSEGLVERLQDYSNMEKVLSRAGKSAMYKAIHSNFIASVVQANTRGGQGVVGSRGGALTPLLGFTPFEYKRRLQAHVDKKNKMLGKNVNNLADQLEELKKYEESTEINDGEAPSIRAEEKRLARSEKHKQELQSGGAQCGVLARDDVTMTDADVDAATEVTAEDEDEVMSEAP